MTTRFSDAEKQLDALKETAGQFDHLRIQAEKTHQQSAKLLEDFFVVIEKDRSSWDFKIIGKDGTITEGPLNREGYAILRTAISAQTALSFGAGFVLCPERTGCSFVGEFAGKCVYICKQVKLG